MKKREKKKKKNETKGKKQKEKTGENRERTRKGRKRKEKKGKKREKNTLWYCLERKRNFLVPFKSFSTNQQNSSPNAQQPRFEEEPADPALVGMNTVVRHYQVNFPLFFFFFGHHLYFGLILAQLFWADLDPIFSGLVLAQLGWA